MGILDHELIFSDAQALTATANSTNLVDMQAASQMGSAISDAHLLLNITAKGASTPTIAAALVGADDEAFSVNKVTVATTGTLSDPALGLRALALPLMATPKRYYRVEYTLGGGGGSPTFTVTAALQLNPSYRAPGIYAA